MRIPAKLQKGDEIRVIAPSRSAAILSEEGIEQAKKRLENLGFVVTFGKHIFESDLQFSSTIEHRVEDIHDAFRDQNVKGILTVIGGFNSNELLPYLDFDLIKANPKMLCGYSDITALATAITTKADFITYSGPHFSSFQMEKLQEYQTEYFRKCLMETSAFIIEPSDVWTDDAWYLDQENRQYEPGGWRVYQEGSAKGQLFGGNLCTLNLLQGTEYMPNLKDGILFVEDDELTIPETFARDLTSLLQTAGIIKALVIGRFQRASKMTEEQLLFILDKHPLLQQIPVLYDVDFGHIQPFFTFPIGGEVEIDTKNYGIKMTTF
ncbi:U61 family carboxypeptidase [Niallia circulans]|uniref:LD-carboxypeptidase n=1 Tax=Niallia circulans TaxID=1397 RepID=A0AA91TRM7_NIACI|nr:S66 peptidase family protein [Niallia circulans]AYV72156.1 LD-carboxypeptidase [Niallia circulans]MDR4317015.1 LD-carboxypeptidase [Niallia circulans]MED3837993.1 LD-carboxypeptidase [Niallia circulans]MED4241676.1 LD-carboxypeptidase [Niallia circulans]MED4247309.1 LD-carboxypeptidase [Niallia circulans]